MKRYEFFCSYDGGGPADEQESEDGEFVRFADAEAAVKQARIDALEEARKHCDELAGFLLCYRDKQGADLVASVRDSIESLKGKKP